MKNVLLILIIYQFFISFSHSATGDLYDERVSETKHNFSPSWRGALPDPRYVNSSKEDICVFCHSLHGTSDTPYYLTWNRLASSETYTPYSSTSIDAVGINQPKSYSQLCLSCHDGSLEIGRVVNAPGPGGLPPGGSVIGEPWTGTAPDLTMPYGNSNTSGEELTGNTRRLGSNLTNDHPVSFVLDSTVINNDGELTFPDMGGAGWGQYPGVKLYPNQYGTPWNFDSVQCTSCHNPHSTYEKFLRGNLYQLSLPADNTNNSNNILCLACHKSVPEQWGNSTHAKAQALLNPNAENIIRDGSKNKSVWEVACLACHDVHTVQGAVRLTRNGVEDVDGGIASIENTCYMCHASNSFPIPVEGGNPLTNSAEVPNDNEFIAPYIRDQFEKDSNLGGTGSSMNLKFDNTNPGHEPVFVKTAQEGVELIDKTHIECVDCHNPHQAEKTNRLKGMKGVAVNSSPAKLVFNGSADTGCFSSDPAHNGNCNREPYVYEVCLRCHGNTYSDIFVDDNGVLFPDETNKRSDPSAGLPANSNFSFKGYSNKRLEFDPGSSLSANSPPNVNNTSLNFNTAYHPVASPGRNLSSQLFKQLRTAFGLTSASQLGSLTIQCTDCHNNDDYPASIRGPVTGLQDGTSYKRITDKPSNLTVALENDPAYPQGPHGSNNIRILRGNFNTDLTNPPVEGFQGLGSPDAPTNQSWFELCFKCHDSTPFLTPSNGTWTNFYGSSFGFGGSPWDTNFHYYHIYYADAKCHECHMNIHSNVQATNTIYGDGNNGQLPPDGNTHLINFNPSSVTADQSAYPRWWYDSSLPGYRCNMRCHGVTMVRCAYQYGTIFGPGPNNFIFWPRYCTTSFWP